MLPPASGAKAFPVFWSVESLGSSHSLELAFQTCLALTCRDSPISEVFEYIKYLSVYLLGVCMYVRVCVSACGSQGTIL